MTILKKNHMKIFPGLMSLVFILSACGFGSGISVDGGTDPTPIINSIKSSDSNNESLSTPIAQETSKPNQTPEKITVFRLDGSQEEIPFTYTSSTDLLEAKVASGEWTKAEGLVILLKIITGEIEFVEVPGLEQVVDLDGTGIVRTANEFVDQEDNREINRLLAKLFPTQEVLDQISQPSDTTSAVGPIKIAMPIQQVSPQTCELMAQNGFQDEFIEDSNCYLYEEETIDGFSYRVYYPSYWQGDEVKENLITATFQALIDSVVVYNGFGKMENINIMFSLLPDYEKPTTLAFQTYTLVGETCPLTLLPTSSQIGTDAFMQTVAHELFHCFQDWNYSTESYSDNK